MASKHARELLAAFAAAGHRAIVHEETITGTDVVAGEPDLMAYSEEDPDSMGGHNGPQCAVCGFAICEWCWARYGHKIEPCDGAS